jgi:S-adenosyl methyltransferase
VEIDLQTDRAHSARIYDYILGGKDNYPADRAAADEMLQVNPSTRTGMLANRAFLRRVVHALAAECGIRQFLDLGTGIPTSPNVHEVAQAVDPECRVVYVDNDPIVLAHARALLVGGPQGRTVYVEADMREPATILSDPHVLDVVDPSEPAALVMVGVVHGPPAQRRSGAGIAGRVHQIVAEWEFRRAAGPHRRLWPGGHVGNTAGLPLARAGDEPALRG